MNYEKLMDVCSYYISRNGPTCSYTDIQNLFKKLNIFLEKDEFDYICLCLYAKRRDLDKVQVDDIFEHYSK